MALWTIWLPAAISILYGLGLYLWTKKVRWRLSEKKAQKLRYLHYALLSLTVLSAALVIVDDISYAGQWTTRAIIIGFLISGSLIYPICSWIDKPARERIYFRLFSFLPIVTSGLIVIPFWGVAIILSLCASLISPYDKILYEDKKLRVQSTFYGALSPPILDVVEKRGLVERRLNVERTSAWEGEIDSVRIMYGADSTMVELFYQSGGRRVLKVKKIEGG